MKIIDISNGNQLIQNKNEIETKLNKTFDFNYFLDSFLDFNKTIYVDIDSDKIVPFSIKKIDNELYIYLPAINDITNKLLDTLKNIKYNLDNLIEVDIQEISKKSALNEISEYFIIANKFFILK